MSVGDFAKQSLGGVLVIVFNKIREEFSINFIKRGVASVICLF